MSLTFTSEEGKGMESRVQREHLCLGCIDGIPVTADSLCQST